MAKRHHKKKTHTRRRRVGAKSDITDVILRIVGVAGGAVLGAFGVQAVNTAAGSSLPAWAAPVGAGATGAVIPHLIKGSGPMQSLGMGIGDGLLAIGAVMTLNETLISVPGISGLAMSSNAGPQSNVLRTAVGKLHNAVAGPNAYLNRTVGNMHSVSASMGALVSD
jgi:hypothetical protein